MTNTSQIYNNDGKQISSPLSPVLGTVAQPSSGTIAVVEEAIGSLIITKFTLAAARLPVTDGAASGSFGSLKLYDLPEGAVSFLGSRQDYTAFAEGSALTGGAGDAAFVLGLGTGAIAAAADATLGSTTNVNIGASISVTLAGGTGAGTAVNGPTTNAGVNGTGTAADINLNWSGSAATIDANSHIDVTGTIQVAWLYLGDD